MVVDNNKESHALYAEHFPEAEIVTDGAAVAAAAPGRDDAGQLS